MGKISFFLDSGPDKLYDRNIRALLLLPFFDVLSKNLFSAKNKEEKTQLRVLLYDK